jgi:PAS domain S-box-containing protein
MTHVQERLLAYALMSFSLVALLVLSFTATSDPLANRLPGVAIALFALFLVAESWVVLQLSKSLAREHHDADALKGRYTAAAATCDGWLYVLDTESRFVYSSDASIECIGYQPAELLGTEAKDLLSPEELQKIDTRVGGLPQYVNTLVVRGRHRNGQDRWFEVTVAPVLAAASKENIGWSGTARPLTEAKHPGILREIHRRAVTEILRTQQLVTAFQPIVDIETGRPIGVEALSRFPSRADVTPDVIFAEAANAGLGLDLELLAVRSALSEARLLDPTLYVAVNVSPAVLANPALADALQASGFDLRRVVLEITEHAAVGDYTVLERPRQRLRELGVRLAIDDAGAGYASLRHIVTLAPDIIKVDRTLVADIDTDRARRALVMAVVMFALEIGTTTLVAEGVETPEELDALTSLGVDAAQGYLIGRPTSAPEEWLLWGGSSAPATFR